MQRTSEKTPERRQVAFKVTGEIFQACHLKKVRKIGPLEHSWAEELWEQEEVGGDKLQILTLCEAF